MSKIVGIDLGTTNSLISVVEGGVPTVIPSAEGDFLFPSVVGFSRNGDRLVGSVAKRQAISNPERTFISVKRSMGTDIRINVDDRSYTPQEISAMILQKVKADAEAYLGFPVEKADITVPAYFNDSERQATKDAGSIAGLEVLRIINEPTASCMAYGLDKIDKSETVLIWDLGGGTFDVSILEIGGGVFQVKATAGNARLGGDDWDQRIMDWLVDEFRKSSQIDLRTDRVAMQRLKEAAENAKIKLSAETATQIKLPFIAADASGPKHLDLELTRARFQELTSDLIEKTAEPAIQALEDAGLGKNDIDKVLLVGGSTRMPAVQDKVRALFGKEPSKDIDPDKVVAMGAAVQGAVMAGEVKDMVLLDVTSLSLGIETMGGVFTKLIERNTQIPVEKTRVFTTATDGQTVVEVHVLQGERDIASHNKSLGRFELRNIPPAPRGVPQIEVTFDIDANGIVSVSAKDKGTNKEQKITIQASGGLSDDDIEKMVKDAEANAEGDKKRRELVEARNQAESLIHSTEKSIEEHGDKVDPSTVEAIELAVAALKDDLEKDDVPAEKLKSGIQNVTEAAMKLGEAIYKAQADEGGDAPEAADDAAGPGDDDIVDADFEDLDDNKRA